MWLESHGVATCAKLTDSLQKFGFFLILTTLSKYYTLHSSYCSNRVSNGWLGPGARSLIIFHPACFRCYTALGSSFVRFLSLVITIFQVLLLRSICPEFSSEWTDLLCCINISFSFNLISMNAFFQSFLPQFWLFSTL